MQNFILAPFVCHFHLSLSFFFRTHVIHFFFAFFSGAFTNHQLYQLKLTNCNIQNNTNYKQSPPMPAREERSFAANGFATAAFEVSPTSIRGI